MGVGHSVSLPSIYRGYVMAFMDKFTATEYRPVSLLVKQSDGGEITATFEVALYNAEGQVFSHGDYTITLAQGEKDTLLSFVNAKMGDFETDTGLTRKQAQQPEQPPESP